MKFIFIGIFLIFSLYYLFYYKPKLEKPTVLWTVIVARIFATGFSFFGLLMFPFILLTLNPSYTFAQFFEIYGLIYLSIVSLILFVISLDFTRWAFVLFMRMAGIDTHSDTYFKFKKWYRTYVQK